MYLLESSSLTKKSSVRQFNYKTLTTLKEKSPEVMNAWLKHPNTSSESLLTHFNSIKNDPAKTAQQGLALASNSNCPPSILEILSESQSDDILVAIAGHANTPIAVLADMIKKERVETYETLIQNEKTPMAALRLLAVKAPKSKALAYIPRYRSLSQDDIDLFLSLNNQAVVQQIAMTQELNQCQFQELWSKGECHSLLRNPKINMDWIEPIAQELPKEPLLALLENPLVPPALLKKLCSTKESEVKRALGGHTNTPKEFLGSLAKETRGDVAMSVACNPSTPESVLKSLSLNASAHVREAVGRHKNTDKLVLSTLSNDEEKSVRAAVAANPNTPLETLKQLACDGVFSVNSAVTKNPSMGVVTTLDSHESVLRSSGYGAFSFYALMSPKKVTRLLINSKHPSEVEYLFGSGHCDSLQGLSALQSAFTNRKGKLDRDGYLSLLSTINEQVNGKRRSGLAVGNITLSLVLKHFGPQLIADVVTQYDPDEAKDCLRMLGSVVDFENKNTVREFKGRVERWLSRHRRSGSLHNYLVTLTTKELPRSDRPFYQSRMKDSVNECNKLLDTGWQVNLPLNSQELLAIGDAQRHCVGTQFYADRCMDGSSIIFQIMPIGDMRHGYTFQFSRDGRLLQAKGFANSPVPQHQKAAAKQVVRKMMEDISLKIAA